MIDIGTRVRMSVVGKGKWRNTPFNPHDGVGVVTEVLGNPFYGLDHKVRWSKEIANSYSLEDLEPLTPVSLGDLI